MTKKTLLILLALTLALGAFGCGGDSEEPTDGAAAEPVIADERIIGMWSNPEDGDVEFTADGFLVLANGNRLPFQMPSSDTLQLTTDQGVVSYNVTWEGDDRHGVLSSSSTTLTPTWYDRK